jgi:Ohr subfamily peroxiredoxin
MISKRKFPMTAKVLFTGKTHITAGRDGAARSSDGFLDVKLSQPHPAAENLFGAAWSACYIGALQLAAGQQKVTLPVEPSVDAEIDLVNDAGAFFLRARLDVSLPGVDREAAQRLIEAAHGICPYSKAVHGNIEVTTTLA